MGDFKLSASLAAHEDDVKGVVFPSKRVLISASRDGNVVIWNLRSENPPVYDSTISSHSGGFVNAVAYLLPTAEFSEGLILSGGQEAIIDIRQPSRKPEDNAEALLLGHGRNVCALDVDLEGKYIISGSWDLDARIWPVGKWESEVVLKGHEQSPWAVLAYGPDTIITGSGDNYIRIYTRSGKLVKRFQGSDSPVRSLCRIPQHHPSGADFASAANDGIIRFWKLSGETMGQLHGHESFVYSIAALPSGELVSAGEDRTVRVWKGFECVQTITHPAISVWQVAVCAETGDIATGASDKTVRVFTRDPERFADTELTQKFENAVQQSSIPAQQLPDVNKEKLPGPEFISNKSGTKEGQVQMIKELDGSIAAYMWSAGQQKWDKVGTVVDATGSTGNKTEYGGKEYDYVFDVAIEEGAPALKLPYNLNQNPYEAATKFINDNELSLNFLDQVANFITQNTQGATIGQSVETPSGPGSDPWGTNNRYRPGQGEAATVPPAIERPKILPQKEYLSILVAQAPAIEKKLIELNQALIASGQKDVSLNPTELSILKILRNHIEKSRATITSQSVAGGLELAVKIAIEWPYKDRLPGLDLLRLLAVAPQTATYTKGDANVVDVVVEGATGGEPAAPNHIMMGIRTFVNLFDSDEGRRLVSLEFEKIQDMVTNGVTTHPSNRNLLVAAVTLYINYAVLFKSQSTPSLDYVLAVLDTLLKIASSQKDAEVIYRGLVALGTLITVDNDIKAAAKDIYGVKAVMETAAAKASDPRIKNVVKEIAGLLN